MALAKTGTAIIGISGVSSGNTYRHDQAGQHVYPYTKQVKKQPSTLQTKRRNAFRDSVNLWNYPIAPVLIEMWQIYANNHPTKNRHGDTITLTAYQMFMHINIYRSYTGLKPTAIPPTD